MEERLMFLVILTKNLDGDLTSTATLSSARTPDTAIANASAHIAMRYQTNLIFQETKVYELTENQWEQYKDGDLSINDLVLIHTDVHTELN